MRTTTVKLAAAALLALLLGGAATADPPTDPKKPAPEKKPSQLEELIAQALRDNPDIRVAEAKTREAEAELNRVRLQVIQKVVAHQHTVETLQGGVRVAEASLAAAQAKLKFAEAEFSRTTELKKQNAISPSDLDASRAKVETARANLETAKAALQSAKADLAKAQAELPYLLGKANKDDKQSDAAKRALEEWFKANPSDLNTLTAKALYARSIEQAAAAWQAAALPRGTAADKLRQALDMTVNLDVHQQPLDQVLSYLQAKAGVSIVPKLSGEALTKPYSFHLDKIALGAVFQAVEDVTGVQFGARDYGILVSDPLPPGVKRLHDFWKESDKPKAGEEKKQ
jgi:outer membrane protein TolC